MSLEKGEFSVCEFYDDGKYAYRQRWVSAKEAMRAFKRCHDSPACRLGVIQRLIVTDGGDCVNFEWQYGKGITFPDAAELAKAAQDD